MAAILNQKGHFDQIGLREKSHFLAGGSVVSTGVGRTMIR